MLECIVRSDPLFAPQLVPVIVQLVRDHSLEYDTKVGRGPGLFIEKCVDIIAPLLSAPPMANDIGNRNQADVSSVAEWFLFGTPPKADGKAKPKLYDNGFLGAAKVYAAISRESPQNFEEGRTAYNMICIVERLFQCVPSCRQVLDMTCADAMSKHSPERQAELANYAWDWVVEFAKHCTLQRYMGGDNRNCVRKITAVSVIDSLVRIHNRTNIFSVNNAPPTSFMPGVDYSGALTNSVAKDIANGNTCFLVTGAGSSFCNGEYLFDYYFDSVPKWSRTCVVASEDKMGNRVERTAILTIFRVQMQNKQSRQWYLSEMDPVKPGTNKDVDFYCCSSSTARPPSIGWRKIGKGRDPAPASIRGNADKDRGRRSGMINHRVTELGLHRPPMCQQLKLIRIQQAIMLSTGQV